VTQPNRDLYQAGAALCDYVATNLTKALEHVQRELSTLDGFPGGSDPGMKVTASSELTSVERTADARWAMTDAREQLRDLKAQVLVSIRELNEYINEVQRMRVPKVVVKPEDKRKDACCSSQVGKHGVLEWGDPLCMDLGLSNRGGLCERHWKAWYRARKKADIDTSADFTPKVDADGNEVPAWH
jgi:hypothetical protein